MIELCYDSESSYGFSIKVNDESEKKWIEENQNMLLDLIVDKFFINNKNTNIHTFKEYQRFCTDIEFCLERYYGHPLPKISQLKNDDLFLLQQDFVSIQQECTKFFKITDYNIKLFQQLFNDEFNKQKKTLTKTKD